MGTTSPAALPSGADFRGRHRRGGPAAGRPTPRHARRRHRPFVLAAAVLAVTFASLTTTAVARAGSPGPVLGEVTGSAATWPAPTPAETAAETTAAAPATPAAAPRPGGRTASPTRSAASSSLAPLPVRVAAAAREYRGAVLAAERAAAEAARASRDAVAADRRVDDARDRLARWASYLYRSSGGGELMQLLDAAGAEPDAFLRAQSDAAALSRGLAADLVAARSSLFDARLEATRAEALSTAADLRVKAADAARGALAAVLAASPAAAPDGPQRVVDGSGCPIASPAGTLRDGAGLVGAAALCRRSVAQAATPQGALAIMAAFRMLGAPYACGGSGRNDAFRFDCSSLVSRAYYLGAGLDTAGDTWAPSTRDMVPWDGVPLASWASYVAPGTARPGDLVLYDTGGATYRHVVMLLADGYMLHTNACGDVAHVSRFWGYPAAGSHLFLVARRVLAPGGVRVADPVPLPARRAPAAPDAQAGDPPVRVPVAAPSPVRVPTSSPRPSPSSAPAAPSAPPNGPVPAAPPSSWPPPSPPSAPPPTTPAPEPPATSPSPSCSPPGTSAPPSDPAPATSVTPPPSTSDTAAPAGT